ncbi:hypothetical protein [Spiroplasma taiwanense]|uniref:Uncharacterized protein n=1 Tax=Spiroplasma taiwanense CT-1 TaxID=1276220 RepID=S5LTH3_9MOLU|nr:hypothetical protein [Spiroplasma taiwanense]AGR41009.1 hypothetical protein STAIW_v1c03510 [Spiroplasma taiwanense CT-1]
MGEWEKIILLITFFVFILISILFTILKVFFSKKNKKTVKQITEKNYFINESHKNEKWWVFTSGFFEKKWFKSQNHIFKIKYFNYSENFSKGFLNSSFIETKKILKKFINRKEIKNLIQDLKIYINCLENIW